MSSIVWFVSIAIITRLVESKFIDNELRTGLHLNKRDLRHINLEDNEAINTFETSQYQLRYKTQQRYRGLPVFGATLVVEQDPGDASKKIPIYGRWYDKTDIQQLVPSINPEFGEDEALQIALTALNIDSKNVYSQSPAKLYIYYHDSFPFLCWIIKVSYSNPRKGDEVHHPVVIINALTGRVLQIYDEVFNINAGSSGIEACGDGGNLKTGLYRYCVDYPSLLINDNIVPVLENDVIQVYDNHGNPYDTHTYATKVTCSGSVSNWNATHNVTGNHTSPSCYIDDVYTNGAYCPACDIYAFANVVFEMFDEWSNATYPISAAFIPMKLFVHVGYNWVNANFDPYSGEMNFGDGATSWYPLTTLDITAHEIAHGYTDQGSDLIYSGESGGMNEAFSDIVGEVAEYWFFGENDWMTGGDIFKNVGEALRYMYDPPNDGISIDHYSNYYSSMDVHYSSGLYNKAAYNLNTNGSNWSMEEIFRVFAWANLYYWTADSTFNEGVSGLYQALYDLYDDNMTDVDAMADELDIAFLDVGLARINTSIPDNILCAGSNRFCYYENINASRTAITNHTVSIQANDDSSITYFDIYFTVNDNDCMRPTLWFKYELIDYDSSSEYIDVFDMNDNLISRCQGGFSCGTFDSSCIHNYDLGVSAFRRGETYKIAVVESAAVDDLCGTGPTINAFLTLQCEYGTISPTAEPTNNPSMEPTINPTTATPTQPTLNPTPYPTNEKIDCGVNTFCYIVDVYPSLSAPVESTVIIQNPDDNSDTYFNVFFIIHGNDCVSPQISFEHELIDYDSVTEYIELFDNSGNSITQCQGAVICNQFSPCLTDYDLGVNKIIAEGDHYQITLSAGTADPTTEPTVDPTVEPTQPTVNPTTSAPTPTPPNTKVACGSNRWCFYSPVTPNSQYDTEWNVLIQNEYVSGTRYFDIYFTINNETCVNPQLTFIYERIDYDSSSEYIDVYGDGSLIQRCGAGAQSNLCSSYDTCLSQTDLAVNQIEAGTTYQISLTESTYVNAFCTSSHLWSINANATLHCQGGTLEPTLYPTVEPTQPTVNPPYCPVTQGIISCDESVTGTIISADTHCYKFVPNINTVSTVTFSDCSSDFDPKLFVYSESGEWISQPYCDGDDCGADKCSSPVREVFSIPNMNLNEVYYVLIEPFSSGGIYTIDIQCNATESIQSTFDPWMNMTTTTMDEYVNNPTCQWVNHIGFIQAVGVCVAANISGIGFSLQYECNGIGAVEWNLYYSADGQCNKNTTQYQTVASIDDTSLFNCSLPACTNNIAVWNFNYNPTDCSQYYGMPIITDLCLTANHYDWYMVNIFDDSRLNSSFGAEILRYSDEQCANYQSCEIRSDVQNCSNSLLSYTETPKNSTQCGDNSIPTEMPTIDINMSSTFDPWMDMSTTMDTPTTTNPCECSSDVCYSVDAIGSNYEQVTTNTVINNINDNTAKSLGICYNIIGAPCQKPRFSFEYERIDYDSNMEYLLIYDDNDTLLRNCGGNVSNVCGVFAGCLSEYKLDIDSIDENSTYQITIIQSNFVNALCENNNHSAYSINAGAKLHCGAETNNPTAIPTTIPSIEPTTNPTVIPTAIPTTEPTTEPTTNPTAIPTSSPTDSSCKVDKCYYETVTEKLTTTTVTNYEDSDISLINVEYRFADYNCGNPRLTFQYEKVDVDGPSEYITVEANDTLIADCGTRTDVTNECGKMESCFTNTRLYSTPVYVGQTLKISIAVSEESNALCETRDHQLYTINAVLELRCNQIAVADAATVVDEGAFGDSLFAVRTTVSVVVYTLILLFFCILLAVVIYCWVQRKNRRMDKNDIEISIEMADVRSLDAAPQEKRDEISHEMDEMSTEVLGQETVDIENVNIGKNKERDGMMMI